MLRLLVIAVTLFAAAAQAPVRAQEADTASERERLGNERARIEAERRARETEPDVAAPAAMPAEDRPAADPVETAPTAATSAAQVSAAPAEPPAVPATTPVKAADAGEIPGDRAADAAGITEALEQLRELGELRDAGYVTDEEFDRIKRRILETRF